MVFTDDDSDMKIYKRYSKEDIEKYIDLYLKEKKMGINFDPLFLLAHKDLKKKNWLFKVVNIIIQRSIIKKKKMQPICYI